MSQPNLNVVNEADVTSRCRAIHKPGLYTILPAANRVMSLLPGFTRTQAQVLAAPPLGARFIEHELVVEPGGGTSSARAEALEQFLYVLEGGVELEMDGRKHVFEAGCFCWLPPLVSFAFTNRFTAASRMLWIRRRYEPVDGLAAPDPIIAHEADVPALPTDTYMEKHLTPYENPAFDMGINLQVFDPGVYFSFVESHVMEHGLYMVRGRGLYWLNRDFIEVQKDDFIYMAPFCPQFYYATGWEKSAYLLYKDVNRDFVTSLR